MHREQVMEHLWPDSGKDAAANSLRGTLHTARKVLGAEGSDCLVSENGSLLLCPEGEL
jgi:DNA-binding SARP family transcriptional activator